VAQGAIMIETIAIADVFVTELGKIERISNSCNRFYFCTYQDGELQVVAKLIIPTDCLTRMIAARERMLAELGPVPATNTADQLCVHH
jgi:hypothetical protein